MKLPACLLGPRTAWRHLQLTAMRPILHARQCRSLSRLIKHTCRTHPPTHACERLQGPGGKARPRALRVLAEEQLGLTIQAGEHNPVDDARAALYLYLKHRKVG